MNSKKKKFIRRPKVKANNNNNKNKRLCASAANGSADLREQPRLVPWSFDDLLAQNVYTQAATWIWHCANSKTRSQRWRQRRRRLKWFTWQVATCPWEDCYEFTWRMVEFSWLHITTSLLFVLFVCVLCRFRRQGGREQYGYSEVTCRRCARFPSAGRVRFAFSPLPFCPQVVLKGAGKKLSLLGVSWCNGEGKNASRKQFKWDENGFLAG